MGAIFPGSVKNGALWQSTPKPAQLVISTRFETSWNDWSIAYRCIVCTCNQISRAHQFTRKSSAPASCSWLRFVPHSAHTRPVAPTCSRSQVGRQLLTTVSFCWLPVATLCLTFFVSFSTPLIFGNVSPLLQGSVTIGNFFLMFQTFYYNIALISFSILYFIW